MSLVKILQKPIKGKEPLIFVGDGNSSEATFMESWDSLTNYGDIKTTEIKFDRVSLYNAVKGFLDENGISYKAQGKVSTDYLLRLDYDGDKRTLMQFLAEVKKYDKLENSSKSAHSQKEQQDLEELRKQLTRYASKYR